MTHAISRLLRWLPDSDRGLSAFSTDTSPVISLQLQTANNDALADHICLVVPRSRRGTDGVEVPREYLADLMRLLAWWLRGKQRSTDEGIASIRSRFRTTGHRSRQRFINYPDGLSRLP